MTERLTAKRAGKRRITQRWSTPLAAILLAAVAWFAWERFAAPMATPAAGERPGAARAEPGGGQREAARGGIYYGPANSLAVLPFADRSPAADQPSQALGFAAELLERFVGVPGLQATARRSAFFFRDESVPPRVIAERLQSAYLLRGEWRNDDGRLTVMAALYDARRDRELWRKDYAGRLAELPALRDVVVGDVLNVIPGLGAWELPAAGTIRPEAWLSLQQGLYLADPLSHLLSHPPTGLPRDPDLRAAQAALQAALDLDPAYEEARLGLAELLLHPAWPQGAAGANSAEGPVEQARRMAETVLRRNPGSARAWGLVSYIRHRHDRDWQGAVEAGRRAAAARPGDATLLATASLALFTVAEFEQARELLEASIRRDPLNLGSRLQLGLLLEFSGQYDEALATYRQVLALHPQYPAARAHRARVKVLQGKPESALRESGQEADPFWRRYAEILALAAAARTREASPLLEQMISEDGAFAAFQLAELFAFEGQVGQAFEWLERARQQRDPGLSALLGNPLLTALHDDPRWPALLADLGLPLDSPR